METNQTVQKTKCSAQIEKHGKKHIPTQSEQLSNLTLILRPVDGPIWSYLSTLKFTTIQLHLSRTVNNVYWVLKTDKALQDTGIGKDFLKRTNNTGDNQRIDRQDYIKLKSLCVAKKTIIRVKKTVWKEIFAKYTQPILLSISKELLPFHSEQAVTLPPIQPWL